MNLNRVFSHMQGKMTKSPLKAVSPVQILHGNINPPACHFTHDVPAMVFSSGGFTGNLFHEFNEVIIPLFITSQHFWYKRILKQLSAYNAINPAEDGSVHCFPGAVIGLKYHDNLALNTSDILGGYSMSDFKHFLRKSYSLKITTASEIEHPKPHRLIISSLDKFAQVVNSCSVMVGAHGAGLANSVLLPAGAVMVQVVPLGLDWASAAYYGDPARKMGVQYLEYKIEAEESSLFDLYGRDHPIIADPQSIHLKGCDVARAVYLDGEDMKINLVRFREILVQARKLLGNPTSFK
ncbi:alpha-1,3-arabinosyltransferase XAT3-like [Vitis riparia]|uniref:alpha-1,3-arabinosyltransferase XAT3-like n=1 Tax=Vitis riparia TaxID=96939 RepID=UPI00155B24E4|nr:alpha-1,3-arabinosyltransferase XAT3-like [Vitis riparia]